MRRSLLTALVVGALLVVTLPAGAAPAGHAGPPIDVDWDGFFITDDEEHGLYTFINIGRDALCDWVASDFDGPPPVNGPMTFTEKETGKGAVVERARALVEFEIWEITGPPEAETICADGLEGPWGTATGYLHSSDNDLLVSGTRSNSFGRSYQIAVTDREGGTWRYSFHVRFAIDRDGEFHERSRGFSLTRTGRPA